MRNMTGGLMLACLGLVASPGIAADAAGGDDGAESETGAGESLPAVGGTLGAGALITSGNTESEAFNADVSAEIAYAVWRHKARFSGYRASEEGDATAERYSGSVQSDYRFSERSYLFAHAGYESDKFGAFDRKASISAGLGHRFLDADGMTLDLEGGLGRRSSEPDGTNDREQEAIARFHGEFVWAFAETSRFSQELELESGDSNTASRSVSAIRSRLVGDLSWRLSHTLTHNSDVPAGTDKTDTFTALALEYAF